MCEESKLSQRVSKNIMYSTFALQTMQYHWKLFHDNKKLVYYYLLPISGRYDPTERGLAIPREEAQNEKLTHLKSRQCTTQHDIPLLFFIMSQSEDAHDKSNCTQKNI